MGNTRQWTSDFNARLAQLERFVASKAGRSKIKRKAAVERAATMPLARQSDSQEGRSQ